MAMRSRAWAALQLGEPPEHFDDDELELMIDVAREKARERYLYAGKLYGRPCREGKRRYDAYLEARAILGELIAERESR